MSNPLADYLSALEARDAREQAHAYYINAFTKLADRTASISTQAPPATDRPAPSPSASSKSIRTGAPKGKASVTPDNAPSTSSIAQMRAELASTHKSRSEAEAKLATTSAELSTFKATDAEQKQRISQLEKIKEHLDRRVKDRADELKGKGRFVEEVQDEMLALRLELNVAEQEKEKLKKENDELTRRWVEKMEDEATRMNDTNDTRWSGLKKNWE